MAERAAGISRRGGNQPYPLEYSTLVFLASNPGIVLTQEHIFEAVWNMDSDSCHSSVAGVIYNLRKKIEPDSRKPTYITVSYTHLTLPTIYSV